MHEEFESIFDYLTRTLTIIDQMKWYDENLEDVCIMKKIIRFVDPRYDLVPIVI